MAENDETIKVIFEADTSDVEAALKKTQQSANKIARQNTNFDKAAIGSSNKLIKNAVESTKLNTKQAFQTVKSAQSEAKFVTARKAQNKVQIGQLSNITKIFAQQNKESMKLYKTDSLRLTKVKQMHQAMKASRGAFLGSQEAYKSLQAKRRAEAAAVGASIGDKWQGPPPTEEAKEEREESKINWKNIARTIANVMTEVARFMAQPIMQGYEQYVAFGRAAGRTIGQGNFGAIDFQKAQDLAFSKQQTAEQAYGAARATGRLGSVTTAQEGSRFFGGSVEEVTEFLGNLRRSGQRFNEAGGGQGRATLFRTFRDATASGLDRSRVGEHLQAVAGAVENVGGQTARDVNVGQISGLLALLGSTGKSGFQGTRGMNVLQQIHEGIRSGGRDEYSQALQLSAFGYGVAGRDTDYYTARLRQDEGIFGSNYGVDNLRSLVQTYMNAGGGNIQNATLAAESSGSFGGLGLAQIRDLFETVLNNGSTNAIEQAINDLRQSQGSVEEQIRDNLREGQATIANRIVDLDNRLVNIGEQVFPAMSRIQNAIIELQTVLMPSAITILRTIADAVQTIRTVIAPFGSASEEQRADSDRWEVPGSRLRDQVLASSTLEEAQGHFRQLRQLERDLDANEQMRRSQGDTSGASRLYHMGERLAGAEEIAARQLENLRNIRRIEEAASRRENPNIITLPTVDATSPTAIRNTVIVNTPGATPNDSRQGIGPRGTGGVYQGN